MANYTVNNLEQAAWLVYINGLEIPVPKVEIHYGVWQMPTATLQMVPHTMLQRIGAEDRLQVAIFYLDTFWNPDNPEFCLFGEFEVVGWSYNNTTYGRFIQLNCVAQTQILEQLHFYYISSMTDIVGASVGSTKTDTSTTTQVKLKYPASLFLEGLTAPPVVKTSGEDADVTIDNDNFIKRPIEFVTNVLAALTRPITEVETEVFDVAADSPAVPRSAASIPGRNFFARWMKMTGFHRKWAALPVLEDVGESGCFPLIKASQDTTTLQALQTQLGNSVGNAGSAWDLLKMVYGYMYMEVAMIPAPPSAQLSKKTVKIQGATKAGTKQGGTFPSIISHFVKPQCTFALPPTCNVIFPCMVRNNTFQENYIQQPTRIYMAETFASEIINAAQDGGMKTIAGEALTTGYPPAVRRRMKDLIQSPESNNKNMLLFPEEFFKGPNSTRMSAPPWLYLLSQQQRGGEGSADDVVTLGSVFDTYAEYEYFRSRFAKRSGGTTMAWNPFILPGFPAMVFDQQYDGFDTMGYVNDVSHVMSAGSQGGGAQLTTQVGLTFMRTLGEFINVGGTPSYQTESLSVRKARAVVTRIRANLKELLGGIDVETGGEEAINKAVLALPTAEAKSDFQSLRKSYETSKTSLTDLGDQKVAVTDYDIAPPEIIPDVRNAFQKLTNADKLYSRLLFPGRTLDRPAAFDWKELLDLVDSTGAALDYSKGVAESEPYLRLKPKEKFKPLFDDYKAAMQYVSRPVCTLREYIETWHNKSMATLLSEGTVEGEYRTFYGVTEDNKQKGAVFWGRIFKLVQGPGSKPGSDVTNIGEAPDYLLADSMTVVDETQGVAQTRRNWDKILEEYRRIVRSEEGRVSPQS